MAALQPGQRLGSYVVEGLLGRGGMAEVYRGAHTALERPVAIKVLSPSLNADPTFPLRFLREAKTVARLNHPNIITVYDFGEQGDLAYLVMEIAPGGTYQDRAGRFDSITEAVTSLAPVCEALTHAHAQGVIHRDLKPENILLNADGRPLLADFGLARIAAESLDLSEAGLIMGTPLYMAPEQALAERVDHRADIYALGIVTYTMITGRPPYEGGTFYAVIQRHLKDPPPSIRAALPQAPEALDAAIRRATAKQPEQRYASARDYLTDLQRAIEGRSVTTLTAQVPPRPAVAAAPVATAPSAPSAQEMRPCPSCSTSNSVLGRFCRSCGTPLSASAPAGPTALDSNRTVALSPETVAAIEADERRVNGPPPVAEQPPIVPPTPSAPAAPLALATPQPAEPTAPVLVAPGAPEQARPKRRPTAFSDGQRLTFMALATVALAINIAGLWLAQSGRDAADGLPLEGAWTYIYDNLNWFKSILATSGLGLALIGLFSMRSALLDAHNIPLATYRRLRQYHRFVGYSAFAIAFTIGLLTCVGIYGFATDTPRRLAHSTFGTLLLLGFVAKIGVVRFLPAQRRHLKVIGQAVFVLWVLVFASSVVPWVWGELSGDGGGGYRYSQR